MFWNRLNQLPQSKLVLRPNPISFASSSGSVSDPLFNPNNPIYDPISSGGSVNDPFFNPSPISSLGGSSNGSVNDPFFNPSPISSLSGSSNGSVNDPFFNPPLFSSSGGSSGDPFSNPPVPVEPSAFKSEDVGALEGGIDDLLTAMGMNDSGDKQEMIRRQKEQLEKLKLAQEQQRLNAQRPPQQQPRPPQQQPRPPQQQPRPPQQQPLHLTTTNVLLNNNHVLLNNNHVLLNNNHVLLNNNNNNNHVLLNNNHVLLNNNHVLPGNVERNPILLNYSCFPWSAYKGMKDVPKMPPFKKGKSRKLCDIRYEIQYGNGNTTPLSNVLPQHNDHLDQRGDYDVTDTLFSTSVENCGMTAMNERRNQRAAAEQKRQAEANCRLRERAETEAA